MNAHTTSPKLLVSVALTLAVAAFLVSAGVSAVRDGGLLRAGIPTPARQAPATRAGESAALRLQSLILRGSQLRDEGRYKESEPLLSEALTLAERAFGPDSFEVAASASRLLALALSLNSSFRLKVNLALSSKKEKHMKKENSFALCCVGFLLLFGAACQTADKKPEATANSSASSSESAADGVKKPEEKKGIISASEKADYVATAEDLWKEHAADREKKQEKNQDKYKGKIVEISGRFLQADLDKTVNGEYSTRLSAGAGPFDWVRCNVEEVNKDDFAKLKKDQKVTLKGMGDEFWLTGPTFKHCILLEAN